MNLGTSLSLTTQIHLSLKSIHSPPPSADQVPQRSVSRRVSSRHGSRARERSGGSMIVHDIDDDEEPESMPLSEPLVPAMTTRTRKAKETQTRLGVGRPVVAGGSGARAATKSTSVSKQKRGRSKGTKPTETTIREGKSPSPSRYLTADRASL
jgi:hypothetical protein